MRIRCALVVLLSAGAAGQAHANGAMGLALEMFDYAYWWPYVVATIVLEAWMIGRWLGDGWSKALGISVVANALTAGFCPLICVPLLHGAPLNPNPFMHAVELFASFGLVSAIIEAVIWKVGRKEPGDWVIVRRSVLAHAVGVPLAIVILLIPARPYKGLEYTANASRQRYLRSVLKAYVTQAREAERFPQIASAEALIARFGSVATGESDSNDFAAAYRAEFHRFDLGEAKRLPYAWNAAVNGLVSDGSHFGDGAQHWMWLMRSRDGDRYVGVEINLDGGELRPFGAYGIGFAFAGERRQPARSLAELDQAAAETLNAYRP